MSYYFAKTLTAPFDDAVARTTAALKEEGFGIITEIDLKETFKRKLDIDFRATRSSVPAISEPRLRGFEARIQGRNDAALQCHRAGTRRGPG